MITKAEKEYVEKLISGKYAGIFCEFCKTNKALRQSHLTDCSKCRVKQQCSEYVSVRQESYIKGQDILTQWLIDWLSKQKVED